MAASQGVVLTLLEPFAVVGGLLIVAGAIMVVMGPSSEQREDAVASTA